MVNHSNIELSLYLVVEILPSGLQNVNDTIDKILNILQVLPGFEPRSEESESSVITNYTTGPHFFAMTRPGIEPGSEQPQCSILTTIRSSPALKLTLSNHKKLHNTIHQPTTQSHYILLCTNHNN